MRSDTEQRNIEKFLTEEAAGRRETCDNCLCDTCVNLRVCGMHRPGAVPDIFGTPLPCIGCEPHKAYNPTGEPPRCTHYRKLPKNE